MRIEDYNKAQEKIKNQDVLWMTGKLCKVPFGRDTNEFKKIPYNQPFSKSRNYLKANPTKERGWWNR